MGGDCVVIGGGATGGGGGGGKGGGDGAGILGRGGETGDGDRRGVHLPQLNEQFSKQASVWHLPCHAHMQPSDEESRQPAEGGGTDPDGWQAGDERGTAGEEGGR